MNRRDMSATKNTTTQQLIGNPSPVERLEVPQQNLRSVDVKIVGTTELIVHRFSEKALKMIEDIQAKKAKTRTKRNPKKEYEDCFYRWGKNNTNGWNYPENWDGKSTGIPAVALKKAMVTAVSQITGVTKVLARQAFHIDGDILKVENGRPYMRSDHVRIGIKQQDIRYRPAYTAGWTVRITITYQQNNNLA